MDGIGSHGLPAARAHRGEVHEPARRRAERAAAELREPSVRPRADGAARGAVPAATIRITGRRSATIADLQAAKLDEVRAFFRRYYHPANASIALAGDIDPERRAGARRSVLRRDRAGRPRRAGPRRRVAAGDVRIQFEDRVELPRLYLAWLTPAMFAEGDADLDLATDLLANGKTSRLYRRLVFDERLATDVSASQNSREMAGYAQITATAAPGHTLAEIERAILEEIARLAADGPTDEEIERGRVQAEAQFMFRLQTVGGFGGKSDQLNAYNVFLDDPDVLRRATSRATSSVTARVAAGGRRALSRSRAARHAQHRAARPRRRSPRRTRRRRRSS